MAAVWYLQVYRLMALFKKSSIHSQLADWPPDFLFMSYYFLTKFRLTQKEGNQVLPL
jgi:hypothetical protein